MSSGLIQMIKSAFAHPQNKLNDGIGSLVAACSHYRSIIEVKSEE